jgi:glutaredoxin
MTKQTMMVLTAGILFLTACLPGCGMTRALTPPESSVLAAGSKPVAVMYVRPGCPYCREARRFFADRGLPVMERNVLADRQALAEMLEIHVRSFPDEEPIVPLIVIGGHAMSGFDREEVEAALETAGPKPVAAGSKQ